MPARILDMRVYYNTSRPVTVGDKYYQLVVRHADNGFEVGVYHGELQAQQNAASPNDPLKLTFPSDVAEYYLLDTQQMAEDDFNEYCAETEAEGYQPYNPAIHEPNR
jgi:hypothetical protein